MCIWYYTSILLVIFNLLFTDNKAYFASEDDLFQSLSTKLGIPLTFEEKIEEESALNILPSSPYKNLDLNLAQHDPGMLKNWNVERQCTFYYNLNLQTICLGKHTR